jgi:hypothetical protein
MKYLLSITALWLASSGHSAIAQSPSCTSRFGNQVIYHYGDFVTNRNKDGCTLMRGEGILVRFDGPPNSAGIVSKHLNNLSSGGKYLISDELTFASNRDRIMISDGNGNLRISDEIPDWAQSWVTLHRDEFGKFVPNQLVNIDRVALQKQKEFEVEALKTTEETAVRNKIEQEKKLSQDAEAIAKLRAEIAKMNAGQLFAKADELSSQGDTAKARETLRMLISKFPDHPLVAPAAQQLATMSAASSNAAANSNSNAGSGSASGSASGSKAGVQLSCNDSLESYLSTLPNFTAAGLRGVVSSLRSESNKHLASAKAGRLKTADIQGYQQQMQDYKNSGRTALENHDKLTSGGRSAAMCNPPENSMAFAWAATQMGVAFNTWAINVIRCTAGQANPEPLPAFCPF